MECIMFKNGMRPVHPGEILLEDYIKPMGVSVRAVAMALHVPYSRLSEITKGERGVSADTALAPGALLRQRGQGLVEPSGSLRVASGRDRERQSYCQRDPAVCAGRLSHASRFTSSAYSRPQACCRGRRLIGEVKITPANLGQPVIWKMLTHGYLQSRTATQASTRGDTMQAA
jgi:addiction module HigA family antidote